MIDVNAAFFFIALALFLAVLAGLGGYYYRRGLLARRYPYGHWETLLKRLSSVNRGNVAVIALDLVDESGQCKRTEDDSDLDPSQIWPLIGGLQGLEVLERNCAVLVDIVFYVQQWYPEAQAIAEQLRLNAREIEWHLSRLRSAEKVGNLKKSFPDSAQRAVAIYYVMTRRVLALYEQANLPGLADLQKTL